MATQTGRNARTIVGYVSALLEYPRWVIERDVDFTNCRHDGTYNESIAECTDCRFGAGCRWLNQDRTPTTQEPALDDLILALDSSIRYLQPRQHAKRGCGCRTCSWLHEARHFLNTRRKSK